MIFTLENTSAIGKPVFVFVDGKKMSRALMADTKKGFVEYIPFDPKSGHVKLNKKKDSFITKKRKGKVTVEFI